LVGNFAVDSPPHVFEAAYDRRAQARHRFQNRDFCLSEQTPGVGCPFLAKLDYPVIADVLLLNLKLFLRPNKEWMKK